ncbi:MAG: NAD(P)H-hydrate epimerase [Oscillospiraceae bacterium]|nr:NAD(P)H-hydrate epimerase [Oscillospiraceae bacterium]
MKTIKPDVNSEEYRNAISVERMRLSDKYTIENLIESKELMHRAALGIYDSVEWSDKRAAIVCGSGNNGGDGYALAGIIAENGGSAVIFRIGERFSDDGRYYYEKACELGVEDRLFDEDTSFDGFDIIVDCILGTGFRGKPEGLVAAAINRINDSGAYKVCADINSGMNGDTGEALLAVKSDITVSIGYYKKGMFLKDAPRLISNLVNIDIGIVLI